MENPIRKRLDEAWRDFEEIRRKLLREHHLVGGGPCERHGHSQEIAVIVELENFRYSINHPIEAAKNALHTSQIIFNPLYMAIFLPKLFTMAYEKAMEICPPPCDFEVVPLWNLDSIPVNKRVRKVFGVPVSYTYDVQISMHFNVKCLSVE